MTAGRCPLSSPSSPAPRLAGHFATIEQQRETADGGMWLFLVTELMFFGGLFGAYVVYRYLYPDTFAHFGRVLDVPKGTINTAVLLTSSLTMALAVHAARAGRGGRTAVLMFVTLVLGFGFLCIKGVEWHHDYEEGFLPGSHFTYAGPDRDKGELFFRLYFTMTGLHGLHVLIGLGLLALFAWRAARGAFAGGNYTAVHVLGLYWHFVDLIWIFLFPLFYLIDRA